MIHNIDNLLYFYSIVAENLNQAYKDGKLNRPVTIAGISYYITWFSPTNKAIIKRLKEQNYIHLFYTNQRSWGQAINNNLKKHEVNERLIENLLKWKQVMTTPMGIVEYYNYSIFSGIGIDDYEYLDQNFSFLTEGRNELYAYMHPLLVNPGPKRLTNFLLAQLSWEDALCADSNTQSSMLRERYFTNRYGEYAEEWQTLYLKMSRSIQNAKEMFGENSLQWLLLQEVTWGTPFFKPEQVPDIANLFLQGGQGITLPAIGTVKDIQVSFLGLDSSIVLQQEAKKSWLTLLKTVNDTIYLKRMKDDITWFKATSTRYEILKLMVDFYVVKYQEKKLEKAKSILGQIERKVNDFMKLPITDDTVTQINQRTAVFWGYLKFIDKYQN